MIGLLSKEFRFEGSHMLGFHTGKCKNLHGHSWKVIVTIKEFENQDMVLDFYDFKTRCQTYFDVAYDHAFIYNICDKDECNIAKLLISMNRKVKACEKYTTCENLAKIIFNDLENVLVKQKLFSVKIYESEGSSYEYIQE